METRDGFTLVELLVVVAVIGALAAILYPVLARVKDQARQAKCASNLHQIYLAVALYQEDNGALAPRLNEQIQDPAQRWHYFSRWAYLHKQYTPDKGIFWCPGSRPKWFWGVPQWVFSYAAPGGDVWGCNYDAMAGSPSLESDNWRHIPFQEASCTFITDFPCWQCWWNPDREESAVPPPHPGGWNVLFFDGHLENLHSPEWKHPPNL